MSAPGLVASISGTVMRRKANKRLDRELRNAPKYTIAEEGKQNQALAQSQAFGTDRTIQMAKEDTAQSAADAAAQARNVTNSSSALLQTIAAIQQNRGNQLRGLSQDEAAIQNQKLQQLYGANVTMIDEKDKAWNYNVNMPFQMRVAKYRDQAKVGSEMEMAGVAAQAQTESALVSSFGSMLGGIASDERLKENIEPLNRGIDEVMKIKVVMYNYNPEFIDDNRKPHVGVIAQNLKEVLPEAVFRTRPTQDAMLAVDYNEVVPLLIKGLQDQQQQIEMLKGLVQKLTFLNTPIGAEVVGAAI